MECTPSFPFPSRVQHCCNGGSRGLSLSVLKWAREYGYPWGTCFAKATVVAAEHGHLEVLEWAKESGCPLGKNICEAAARGGHLEVIVWAREKWLRLGYEHNHSSGFEWPPGYFEMGQTKWLRVELIGVRSGRSRRTS